MLAPRLEDAIPTARPSSKSKTLAPTIGVELEPYDRMCALIAEVHDAGELFGIRDKARIAEAIAKIAKNVDAETKCYEIRRRAERQLGKIIEKQKQTVGLAKGSRGQLAGKDRSGGVLRTPPDAKAPTLAEAGIDKNLARDARALASVPDKQFDAVFAEGGRPSIAEITGKKKPQRSAQSETALWVWGRVLDFDRNGTLKTKPKVCLAEMEDFQIEDMRETAPKVIAWLTEFLSNAKGAR